MTIDWRRTWFIVVGGLLGLSIFAFKGWLIPPGTDLSNLVVTIFAVLAGFLLVTFNLLTVARLSGFRSVITQRRYEEMLSLRLWRFSLLFYAYLIILFCVFYSHLVVHFWPWVGELFERLYLGMSGAALLWSLGLPSTITTVRDEEMAAANKKGSARMRAS
jgi:hypothetical protein